MADPGQYSVLLPGGPQTAAQAANEAFPGATPQTVLPEITVTGTYSGATATPNIDTANWDLNPIQVTAQKMGLPATSSIMDWLKPPKIFLTVGIIAGVAFFVMGKKPFFPMTRRAAKKGRRRRR